MSRRPLPRLTLAAAMVAAAVLIDPGAVSARQVEPPNDEAARVAEAERACLEGNHQRGIELLTALYLTSRHPTYLHNQARCYEQNGQYRQAAGRYREFLHKLAELPPGEESAGARPTPDKIAAIEARAAKLEQLATSAAASPPGALPAVDLGRGEERGPADVAVDRPAQAEGSAGAGWRGTGITLIAIGGLALAGSGAAGLLARRTERDISQASSQGGKTFDPGQYRAGERAARLATAGFIAAPAAALVGALLYWRGASVRGGQQARVRVVPTLAAEGLGGLLAVSY
jgi:hypothetical protein